MFINQIINKCERKLISVRFLIIKEFDTLKINSKDRNLA